VILRCAPARLAEFLKTFLTPYVIVDERHATVADVEALVGAATIASAPSRAGVLVLVRQVVGRASASVGVE
jgi:catalase (peroxidase I)